MTFLDLNLSLTTHPVKKDIISLKDDDAIKQALKNLILTENYERGFEPNFGSVVHSLLFENMTVTTTIAIRKTIEVAIRNFESRVSLTGVEVIPFPENNYYKINIYYFIANSEKQFNTTIFLEKLR
jgi:phage baseplate assembly protein W